MSVIFLLLMGFVLFIIIAELIVDTIKDDKKCLLGGLLSFLFVSITGVLIEVNTIAAIIFLIISVFLIFYSISDIIKQIKLIKEDNEK